jgi:hypothetical protein
MRRTNTVILLLLLTWMPHVSASTVAQLSFEDVVADAALIFEGRVLAVESRETGAGRIHTFVRFEVLDVLKGEHTAGEIELRYLGGQVGNRLLEVSHMQIPGQGETGFYFVESLAMNLVHPLVGWAQGHFLIEQASAGEARVHTADNRPVFRISSPDPSTPAQPMAISQGTASGVQVIAPGVTDSAMTTEQFRSRVQDFAATQGAR